MDKDKSITEVIKALDSNSNFIIRSADELNRCIDHIVHLIKDAARLYEAGSFSTSAFLSIIILEEVGKTHVALFNGIRKGKTEEGARSRDPLRDHKTKQIIGSNYTISMGTRVIEAIGKERLEEIYSMSYDGKLKTLREVALYWDCGHGTLTIPEELIDQRLSRDLLLFAIESFDDNLVGYSNYSFVASEETDRIFEQIR